MVQPALAGAISKTVKAIASTPHHPERLRFADVTGSLANRAAIPQTGSGGARIIGIPGFVRDASSGEPLIPVDLDRVRSFVRFAATIYSGVDVYQYCINGDRIEHTRTNVVIGVCVYTRTTTFTGNIALDDWHEDGLVAETVRRLATKESMFMPLHDAAKQRSDDHMATIRSYGAPELYGKAQAAPSST
jgi:hypothetical protein